MYKQGHSLIQTGLEYNREIGTPTNTAIALLHLGRAVLAMGARVEARQLLEECVAVVRGAAMLGMLVSALACLVCAARGLGDIHLMWQHLAEALRVAAEIRASEGPFVVPLLPAIALLLVDRGEGERAVELYSLASRYPQISNSRWFEDVAGQHIAAVAATLPPDVVAAAQERGWARDLDATLEEWLIQLEGKVWY